MAIKQGPQSSGVGCKYQNNYLNFGFIHSWSKTHLFPQCYVHSEKLSNEYKVLRGLNR